MYPTEGFYYKMVSNNKCLILTALGLKFGTHFGLAKKPLSFGLSGTKQAQLMNRGPILLPPQFLSKAFSASWTLVNRSNINYGIAFKLEELGDGLHSSCTSFVGSKVPTMIVSVGSKLSLEKWFPRNMAKRLRFGISLGALLFGPFGLNVMIGSLTKNNGTCQRSSTVFGMNSSSTPKQHGIGCKNKLKLAIFWRRPCSKASTKLGALGMSFVGVTICKLSGIGVDNLGRLVFALVLRFMSGVALGRWGGGDPWFGGSGGCPWWVSGLVSFMWWCFVPEGSRLPSIRVRFLLLGLIHFGVAWVDLMS